ncbi:MotA/TolQ/ExbB proton channel family protein [Methanimicrococcus blatticola]|uniref:Biopolymer transport protein ExbB/TolQ n=1 Tax=Methanimicrococcus blatticola TaxID=91560 RepID=A0A484F5V1_9EURY|nr:MotA/TolQ/ExbB proton channel family protein [Methanimicrococcus blatticola]MBZ3935082.1 MotA/TolQ/ExbB proton channel family protein [Methanimicrococcus blatticola]MCC2508821.1 MotA/TolQ/ExbB proton channel family protein [Methanimicrococcus blatticola]TDQ71150.1 biopolymer transport protein ExbB/TolQ [Methanimicrococcus blatticola]
MAEIALLSDFGSTVSYITYIFSNSLLYPVMLLLILFVILSLILAGEFITEYTRRHRDQRILEKETHKISNIMESSASAESKYKETASVLRSFDGNQTQMVAAFAKDAAVSVEEGDLKHVEKIADDYEVRMMKRTEKTRIITTVGPMLGLMGTLIPLGPALIGLTDGNIDELATNLVIAFATTVIGLFVAGISFCLTTIRNRWYWQDMIDIDYIIDALEEKK